MDDTNMVLTLITALGFVAAGLMAFFKGTDLYARIQASRLSKAWDCVYIGAQKTYDTYVRAIKESATDGKLTSDERKNARMLARQTAIEYGGTVGVDVVREIGHEFLDVAIELAVKRLKAGSVAGASIGSGGAIGANQA